MPEANDHLYALEQSIERLIDNQAMMMDGVQIVVHSQTKTDTRLDGLVRDQAAVIKDIAALKSSVETTAGAFTAAVDGFSKEMRWMRIAVFVVLLAFVAVTASFAKPTKAPIAMVSK